SLPDFTASSTPNVTLARLGAMRDRLSDSAVPISSIVSVTTLNSAVGRRATSCAPPIATARTAACSPLGSFRSMTVDASGIDTSVLGPGWSQRDDGASTARPGLPISRSLGPVGLDGRREHEETAHGEARQREQADDDRQGCIEEDHEERADAEERGGNGQEPA